MHIMLADKHSTEIQRRILAEKLSEAEMDALEKRIILLRLEGVVDVQVFTWDEQSDMIRATARVSAHSNTDWMELVARYKRDLETDRFCIIAVPSHPAITA